MHYSCCVLTLSLLCLPLPPSTGLVSNADFDSAVLRAVAGIVVHPAAATRGLSRQRRGSRVSISTPPIF